jgi:hypothetical protein
VFHGDCVGQIILIGVGDVECEMLDADNSRICLDATAETPSSYQYNPKSYKKPWVGDQSAGGPETTSMCDPDAPTPEPCGVWQPIAFGILTKILYAARMCRYDLLRAVCGPASCTTKLTPM